MLPAVASRREPRVCQQIYAPGRFDQSFPRFLVSGEMNDKRAVVAGDEAVDAAAREVLARDRLTAVQVVGDVGFDESEAHLKQRGINELPAAGFLTREEGGKNTV